MNHTSTHSPSSHLDIGCGGVPRNPYHRQHIHAIDTRALTAADLPAGVHYKQVNFAIDPLPFPDNHFDSVSAYDVLEHIPRQLLHPDGYIMYPFIQLMNEIHRVLKPNGLFLATTPGYPRPEAFQDPTHVNIITLGTIDYFSGTDPVGRMYGFTGDFSVLINRFCVRNNYYDRHLNPSTIFRRRWHRKLFKSGWAHIIWEMSASKPVRV